MKQPINEQLYVNPKLHFHLVVFHPSHWLSYSGSCLFSEVLLQTVSESHWEHGKCLHAVFLVAMISTELFKCFLTGGILFYLHSY